MSLGHGSPEPVGLLGELGGAGSDGEQRPQEVLRSRVLVEPSRQVGDAGIDLIVLYDRGVEQQRAGNLVHGAALRGGHAFQHLQIDAGSLITRQPVSQHERPGNVEQIVAGEPDANGTVPLGAQRRFEHQLVTGIDVGLGGVRRGDPVVQLCFDRLHRQVGALDDADLDRCTTVPAPSGGPVAQVLQHLVAVGKVRLQDDACLEMMKLGLVEHMGEGVNRQLKIAVLLHVEVDEPARLFHQRSAIYRAEWLADPLDAAVEVEHVEVGYQSRGLDRYSTDVGSAQLVEHLGDTPRCFVVTEDRLAQWIDQQTDAFAPALLGVCAEPRIFCRQHDSSGFGENSTADQGHHDLWQRSGELGARLQQQTVDTAQRRRKTMCGDDIGEPTPGAAVRHDPQHLVGQPLNEFATGRVGHQAAQPLELATFAARRCGQGLAQDRIGERNCLVDHLGIAGPGTVVRVALLGIDEGG